MDEYLIIDKMYFVGTFEVFGREDELISVHIFNNQNEAEEFEETPATPRHTNYTYDKRIMELEKVTNDIWCNES